MLGTHCPRHCSPIRVLTLTSSAYSLSGHISLSVTSPYSFFEARKTARLLLQSVSLTFEGQSEIFTPSTGYSSVRLCSITRELAPSTPIELSNEGHEEDVDPCTSLKQRVAQ
jgi:hypothetical protein